MFMPRLRSVAVLTALVLGSSAAWAEGPNLGIPVSQADMAAWDINVLPDGTGLPPGSGTAAQGSSIYEVKCAVCHGPNGAGGMPQASTPTSSGQLVGGAPVERMGDNKTIHNYWPYATTLFDFIRRAMPFGQPRSLTDDEVYALVAYILALNELIDEDDVMNAETLPPVQMPALDRFVVRYPEMMP